MTISKKLLFELSGEHTKLPFAELESVSNALSRKQPSGSIKPILLSNRLAQIELNKKSDKIIERFSTRLSMSHSIHELLDQWSARNINTILSQLEYISYNLPPNSTFKLRSLRMNKEIPLSKADINKIKEKITQQLSEQGRVDVKNPDFEIVLFLDDKLLLTKKIIDIPRGKFETRKPQNRPYFAPVSLHPRLARCLINLASLREHEILLDPFCGTGGLLIEAGLMGIEIIGSDIDSRMVEGAQTNLEHEGIEKFTIIQSNVNELSKYFSTSKSPSKNKLIQLPQPHAIVTEPPYGRASTTQGKTLSSMLEKAFKIFSKILLPNGRLVITLPEAKLSKYAKEDFRLLGEFYFRVHKSLTKNIFIFELKN